MKTLMQRFAVSISVALSALTVVAPVHADGQCRAIHALGVGQDLGGGRTEARVLGGGVLHGTTAATFTNAGVSGAEASLAGTVRFTTNKATLTVSVTGSLNTGTGAFSVAGPVSAATGKLAGSTGSLAFQGVENLSSGTFTERIAGTLCHG
jgi:hypothetical protein